MAARRGTPRTAAGGRSPKRHHRSAEGEVAGSKGAAEENRERFRASGNRSQPARRLSGQMHET